MNKKAIGVLGGMGPEASAYMYSMLIRLSIEKFGAINNDNFPEIILYSIPVPDFISSEEEKEKALSMLIERTKDLNKLNISNLAIACNTAHLLLHKLQSVSKIPFVSMIDEVVLEVKKNNIKKIGLLGTPVTIKSNMYQNAFQKEGIQVLVPDKSDIKILESIIRNIIKGKIVNQGQRCKKIADALFKNGAESIVLGCTELPLVFTGNYSLPVYNSLEILSIKLLKDYYKNNFNLRGGENL